MDTPLVGTSQLRLRTVNIKPFDGDHDDDRAALDEVLGVDPTIGKATAGIGIGLPVSSRRTISEASIFSFISGSSDGESFEFWSLSHYDADEAAHTRASSGISSAAHSRYSSDTCPSPVAWPTTSDSPPTTPPTPFRRLRAVSRTLSDLPSRDARPLITSYWYPLYIRCTDAMLAASFVFSFIAYWMSRIAPLPKFVKRPFAWMTYGSIHRLLEAVGPFGELLLDLGNKDHKVTVRYAVGRALKESRRFAAELARIIATLVMAVIGSRFLLKALSS